MLIILSGLPASGKTTIAKLLARQVKALHVRIDTIEQAIAAGISSDAAKGPVGYIVAYRVAADNLKLGMTVIADSVNPVEMTRTAWRSVAAEAGVAWLDVEILCSDVSEHRQRAERRHSGVAGHDMPQWADIMCREYETWTSDRLQLDTATRSAAACAAEIARQIHVPLVARE